MGRASRKKRDGRVEVKPPTTAWDEFERARAQEYGKKLWSSGALDAAFLERFLPPGEVPIATRYAPMVDAYYVACESGKTFQVTRQALEAAETTPILDGYGNPIRRGAVITGTDTGRVTGKGSPPGQSKPGDKGEGEGEPTPPTLEDRLAVAEARFDEWMISQKRTIPPPCGCNHTILHECHHSRTDGCTRRAEVLMRVGYAGREEGGRWRYTLCRDCAIAHDACSNKSGHRDAHRPDGDIDGDPDDAPKR